MALDLRTVAVLTALVITVSGVLFIAETLLRRDEGAGRIWSLGFFAGMLTSMSYLVWAYLPSAWWAIAFGNTAFVVGTGSMWLGARRFNERPMRAMSIVVAVGAVGAFVSVAVAGPDAGDWAGALWMFFALLLFAAAGSVECFRAPMGRARMAWGLGAVLAVQALFYVGRIVSFIEVGPNGQVFVVWFGAVPTGVLSIVLTIVAVVVTSVLRSSRAPLRGQAAETTAIVDGVLSAREMRAVVDGACERARLREEIMAVMSIRLDDLDQIFSAFGSDTAGQVVEAWRRSVRQLSSTLAIVGQDDHAGLLVVSTVAGPDDARTQAVRLYRGLFDDLGEISDAVIPVIGVGVALSSAEGYSFDALATAARERARRAATTVETSVLIS